MKTAPIFKRDEIILLLGAGASVEAGVPDSNEMVREIQRLVSCDPKWTRFRDLYLYVRSSIFYADGLDGRFDEEVLFNIERLVNVLEEIHKKEGHALYPFVGAWNPKLVEVAGGDFQNVREFRNAIVQILRTKWITLPEKDKAEYYQGLLRFQNEYEHPLRVFSLNYDLCIEETCGSENVQRGFDERVWDWRLFESPEAMLPILLYKLHGSTDWCFTEDRRVKYLDSTSSISDDDVALIFGTSYKLQYIDPFLFFTYELRRWTLDAARIIVCIGYGFNDEHINGILQQSLRQNTDRRLLAVVASSSESAEIELKKRISNLLKVDQCQIDIDASGAKGFLTSKLTLAFLLRLLPVDADPFLEL